VSPGGKPPLGLLNVTVPRPPELVMVWMYAAPTTAVGGVPAVTASAGLIWNESTADPTRLPASVATTVTLTVPELVGDPEIAPVAEFRFSPVGSVPLLTDHV